MKRRLFLIVVAMLALVFGLAGAFLWIPPGPLERLDYIGPTSDRRTLVVLLPGIFDSAGMFAEHGFIDTARAHGIDADLLAVDADLRYYGQGVIVEHLHGDVIAPARASGYRRIVIVGISLGGFGALLYANAHPAQIDRVIVISPFLGKASDDARDPAVRLGQRNGEAALWEWLRTGAAAQARPPLFLAYGEQDKFAVPNSRLAQLMPIERVLRISGEHEWTTWRRLWKRILEEGWLDMDHGARREPANGTRAPTDLHSN